MVDLTNLVPPRARIFTYGTLRPSLYPQVCDIFGLTPVGVATLRGPFKMLNLGRFPGLVHDFSFSATPIVGEVVIAEDLTKCDAYEGYRLGYANNLYDRKEVAVKMVDGSTQLCWVYTYNCPRTEIHRKTNWVVSGDWAKR